ncbi:hypothetical protein [uncultured Paraglaciecola sp.]|uniref:hypothetical protein n=1 Tax=uncultured Paraglaciecola sp. TaxID=1765024 RepID=UPI00261E1C9C|nr:hypothetical protein [uncultured Paraglaciecola sp.]
MAKIVNIADPENASLHVSVEEAEKALAVMLDRWGSQGYAIVPHSDDANRYTVSDKTGQFIGEFHIED